MSCILRSAAIRRTDPPKNGSVCRKAEHNNRNSQQRRTEMQDKTAGNKHDTRRRGGRGPRVFFSCLFLFSSTLPRLRRLLRKPSHVELPLLLECPKRRAHIQNSAERERRQERAGDKTEHARMPSPVYEKPGRKPRGSKQSRCICACAELCVFLLVISLGVSSCPSFRGRLRVPTCLICFLQSKSQRSRQPCQSGTLRPSRGKGLSRRLQECF